ncbi:hypothetical protein [Nostoc sp.]|uniref:hypothetical protein n=1 Tax=Nostoc sp. TaxID=1180 RepID=UPI002FFC19A9
MNERITGDWYFYSARAKRPATANGTQHFQARDENVSKNIEMIGMGHRHDFKRVGIYCKTATVASYCELPSVSPT